MKPFDRQSGSYPAAATVWRARGLDPIVGAGADAGADAGAGADLPGRVPSLLLLRESIGAACDDLQGVAAAAGVGLQLFIDPALPARVWLDGVRWRQILTTLVGHATLHCSGLDHPGCVRVRVERARVNEGAAGACAERLRLSVADNGMGMSAGPGPGGGTGLGPGWLRARRLVQVLGGSLTVLSTPERGLRFVVCLPLVPLPPPGSMPSAFSHEPFERGTPS